MDEPFQLWVRLDSPTFADDVMQGFREATKRDLHPDGEPERIVRDGLTYHVQSFADRVYFYALRHLLLYRRDDGWIMYVTTAGHSSESGLLYRDDTGSERTPLAADAPLAEAQAIALAHVQDHSRGPVTVQWQEATMLPNSWIGEIVTEPS